MNSIALHSAYRRKHPTRKRLSRFRKGPILLKMSRLLKLRCIQQITCRLTNTFGDINEGFVTIGPQRNRTPVSWQAL